MSPSGWPSNRPPALFVLFLLPIRTGDNFDRRPLFAIFDEKPRPRLSLKYELKPRRENVNGTATKRQRKRPFFFRVSFVILSRTAARATLSNLIIFPST